MTWPTETTTKKERAKSHIKRIRERLDAIPDQVVEREQIENPPTDEWFESNRESMRGKGWL